MEMVNKVFGAVETFNNRQSDVFINHTIVSFSKLNE